MLWWNFRQNNRHSLITNSLCMFHICCTCAHYMLPIGLFYQCFMSPSTESFKNICYLYIKLMLQSDHIFSCDQAALWMVQSVRLSVCPSVCLSVRPSVRPSVCHTFLTMFPSSYHHEIFRSYYQWQKWRPCKRSRSEVKGQGHRGHNPT